MWTLDFLKVEIDILDAHEYMVPLVDAVSVFHR